MKPINSVLNNEHLPADYIDSILLGTIALLGQYEKWCQHSYAVTADGRKTKPCAFDAVAWSIEGAIAKVSSTFSLMPVNLLWFLDALVYELTEDARGVGWYNDTRCHGQVIDFLAEAYRRAE
jgi:hypothetical protein